MRFDAAAAVPSGGALITPSFDLSAPGAAAATQCSGGKNGKALA